jgi:hypothetical protein
MSTNNNETGTKNGAAVDDRAKGAGDCGSGNETIRTEPTPATKASLGRADRNGSAVDDKSKSFEVFD